MTWGQMTNIAGHRSLTLSFAPSITVKPGLAITAARAAGCDGDLPRRRRLRLRQELRFQKIWRAPPICSGYAPGTESVAQFEEDYKAIRSMKSVPNMFAPLWPMTRPCWMACA